MLGTLLATYQIASEHHGEIMGITHGIGEGLSKPTVKGCITTISAGMLGSVFLLASCNTIPNAFETGLAQINFAAGLTIGVAAATAALTTGISKVAGHLAVSRTRAHKECISAPTRDKLNAIGIALYTCFTMISMGEASSLAHKHLEPIFFGQKENAKITQASSPTRRNDP